MFKAELRKRRRKIPYCIKESVRLPPKWKEINGTTLETHFNLLLTLFSGSNFLKMFTVLSLPIDSIIFDLALVWANLTCHKISFHSENYCMTPEEPAIRSGPPQEFDERISGNNELCWLPIHFRVVYILLNGLSRVIIEMINILTETLKPEWVEGHRQRTRLVSLTLSQ